MRGLAADRVALRYVLGGVGLLLASPALAVTAYTFLRDDELDAYRGTQLLVRAAVCGVVYMVLWAGFAYLKTTLGTISLPIWALVAPPFLIVGAMAGKFSLRSGNGQRVLSLCVLCRCNHAPGGDCRVGLGLAVGSRVGQARVASAGPPEPGRAVIALGFGAK